MAAAGMLDGRTVLVSGVGAGLGREVARGALRDGARVVLAARTESVLESTAKELDPTGERVAWRRADITSAEDCAALAALAGERFGALHAVVQVAAYEGAFGGWPMPISRSGAAPSTPTCSGA